jgi:hypothetical protein
MAYAYAVGVGGAPSCAEAAVQVLTDVARRVTRHPNELDGEVGEELAFQVGQALNSRAAAIGYNTKGRVATLYCAVLG